MEGGAGLGRCPHSCSEFEGAAGARWARAVIVDYYTRTEEGWLLAGLVKVARVRARNNPTQVLMQ